MAQPNWFRVCVGCRQARHKKELLRIVRQKNQQVAVDWDQKLPGRGAYICPNSNCARLAQKKQGLSRSLKCAVDSGFYEQLIQQVEQVEHQQSRNVSSAGAKSA